MLRQGIEAAQRHRDARRYDPEESQADDDGDFAGEEHGRDPSRLAKTGAEARRPRDHETATPIAPRPTGTVALTWPVAASMTDSPADAAPVT